MNVYRSSIVCVVLIVNIKIIRSLHLLLGKAADGTGKAIVSSVFLCPTGIKSVTLILQHNVAQQVQLKRKPLNTEVIF